MKGMNAVRGGLAFSSVFVFCSQVMALPLTITSAADVIFPVSINSGQSVAAVYTVINNTSHTLTNLYLNNLPSNVTQVVSDVSYPVVCGSSFTLAPGANCTMELTINTAISNPNNANNTTVCIPGTPKICQGFPINVPSSGWSLIGGANVNSIDLFVELLVPNSSTLYAAGHSSSGFAALATYVGGVWTAIFQGTSPTTGNGSVFQALSFIDATHGYLGGHNNVYGTVYSLDTSTSPVTLTDLLFQNHTKTSGGQTEYPNQVDSLLYYSPNGTLYIGGEVNTDLINNYGAVYSYTTADGGTWTNLGLENALFVDSLAITGNTLYAAVVGTGVNFAEVFSYPIGGGLWSDTYLPNTIVEVHSLVVDSKGILYAGGFDNEGGTVWKYQAGQWTSLHFTGGSDVKSLTVDTNDVLYAAGINSNYSGGVWSYSNGIWTTMNPASSSFINSIALFSGSIYAAGQTPISAQGIWKK